MKKLKEFLSIMVASISGTIAVSLWINKDDIGKYPYQYV